MQSCSPKPNSPAQKLAKPPLSATAITEAAVKLIDSQGIDAFSMRVLARQFHVDAMMLYRYFDSKEDLLDSVVGFLAKEIISETRKSTSEDWADQLRHRAIALRTVGIRHARTFPLIATRPGVNPAARAFSEEAIERLIGRGLERNPAIMAWRTLLSFAFGFVSREIANKEFVVTTGSPEAEFLWGLEACIRGIDVSLRRPEAG